MIEEQYKEERFFQIMKKLEKCLDARLIDANDMKDIEVSMRKHLDVTQMPYAEMTLYDEFGRKRTQRLEPVDTKIYEDRIIDTYEFKSMKMRGRW